MASNQWGLYVCAGVCDDIIRKCIQYLRAYVCVLLMLERNISVLSRTSSLSSPDLHVCSFPHNRVRDIPGTLCDMTFLQEGYTPLIVASRHGHVECVKVLLAGDAQVNHQDKVGTVQGWIQGFWKGVVVVWGRILLTS